MEAMPIYGLLSLYLLESATHPHHLRHPISLNWTLASPRQIEVHGFHSHLAVAVVLVLQT